MIDYVPILKLTDSLLKIKCQAMRIIRLKLVDKKHLHGIRKIEEQATNILHDINEGNNHVD